MAPNGTLYAEKIRESGAMPDILEWNAIDLHLMMASTSPFCQLSESHWVVTKSSVVQDPVRRAGPWTGSNRSVEWLHIPEIVVWSNQRNIEKIKYNVSEIRLHINVVVTPNKVPYRKVLWAHNRRHMSETTSCIWTGLRVVLTSQCKTTVFR